MAADRLKKGLPARIVLETTIVQEGEVFQHSFDEMGRLVAMNGKYYLRFTEPGEEQVTTMIKIEPENDLVQLTRHADEKTILIFDERSSTYTNYQTPAGILRLRLETERFVTSYSQSPFAGEIEIDYALYMDEQVLGNYQLRLRFTT